MYKRNIYLGRIAPFCGKPVIKIITGMRRVGKSTLLRQIMDVLQSNDVSTAHILYIDKESLDFEDIRTYKDLHARVKTTFAKAKGMKYLFVDEVQEIGQWEKAITSILREGDVDIYLTGSNAHLFSSELATRLSGRFIEIPVYSLGFEEFLTFRANQKKEKEQEFLRFLRYGGFPGIHHFDLEDEIVYQYVSSIYDTILLKDVVKRHQIRNVSLLENMVRFVFDNIGNVFSAKKIADYVKSQHLRVWVDTVQNYMSFLQASFAVHKVPRYDIKGKRFLEIHEKYYLGDIGMRHALLGYREADISGILENMVFLELKRQGYQAYLGKIGSKEVDFIATKEKEKIYIQVAYLLATPEVVDREFSALAEIKDNYPKFVVSMDTSFGDDREGIKRIPLMDFLLRFKEVVH